MASSRPGRSWGTLETFKYRYCKPRKEELDDGDERQRLPRLVEIIAANLEVPEGDGPAGSRQELQKVQLVGTVPQGQCLQSAERRLLDAGKQRAGERNARKGQRRE